MRETYNNISKGIEIGFWTFLCLIFSFFLSKGAWLPVIAILGSVLFMAALTFGPRPLLIVLLIGSPTFFVFLNSYMELIPFLSMERVLFFTVLGMMFINETFQEKNRVRLTTIEILMIIFLIYIFLSSISTLILEDKPLMDFLKLDFTLWIQGYFMPMLTFMIARRLKWTERDIQLLFRLFVVAGVFLGITSVLQLYFGFNVFMPNARVGELIIHYEERAVGTFYNAVEYGMVISVCIILSVFLYSRTQDTMARMGLLFCLLCMLIGVILSKTRAPWLGTILSLALIGFYDKRARPSLLFFFTSGFIVSIIAIPFLIDISSLSARLQNFGPIAQRVVMWTTGLKMMIYNPFLGIGFARKSFAQAMPDYVVSVGPFSAQMAINLGVPHNEFIYIAALTGVGGIILYIAIFWLIFKILRSTYREPLSSQFEKDIALYTGAVLLIFVINAQFVDIGLFNYFLILIFFLFGMIASLSLKN